MIVHQNDAFQLERVHMHMVHVDPLEVKKPQRTNSGRPAEVSRRWRRAVAGSASISSCKAAKGSAGWFDAALRRAWTSAGVVSISLSSESRGSDLGELIPEDSQSVLVEVAANLLAVDSG